MGKYKVLDLFAGAGGFSYGFSLVKDKNNGKKAFEIIKAVDNDKDACKTLRNHLETCNQGDVVIEGDLTEEKIIDKVLKECKDKVDVIIGGPPCQTFSLVGPARSGSAKMRKALKNDSRNRLFRYYLKIVKKLEPKFIVFENVEGITSKQLKDFKNGTSKSKKVIELICDELETMGYEVKFENGNDERYKILDAAEYGTPQFRKRVFVIANNLRKRKGKRILNPSPDPTHGPKGGAEYVTIQDAIGDLPPLFPALNLRSINKLKKINIIKRCIGYYLRKLNEKIGELIRLWKTENKDIDFATIEQIKKNIAKYIEKFETQTISDKEFIELNKKLNNFFKKLRGKKQCDYETRDLKFTSNSGSKFKEYICGDGKMNKLTSHVARQHNFRDIIIFTMMNSGTTSAHFLKDCSDYYKDKDLKYKLSKLYPYDPSKYADTYVKHRSDKPSKTILAHLAKDGLRFIHPNQFRSFTPREAARLQSFPDSFDFCGGMQSQFIQIGNAVPPLLAKAIGNSIYLKLKKEGI